MTPEAESTVNFFDRHFGPSLEEPIRIYGAKRETIEKIQERLPKGIWKFDFDPKFERFFAQEVKPRENGHHQLIEKSLNTHF